MGESYQERLDSVRQCIGLLQTAQKEFYAIVSDMRPGCFLDGRIETPERVIEKVACPCDPGIRL
jgi:hypothetical protein